MPGGKKKHVFDVFIRSTQNFHLSRHSRISTNTLSRSVLSGVFPSRSPNVISFPRPDSLSNPRTFLAALCCWLSLELSPPHISFVSTWLCPSLASRYATFGHMYMLEWLSNSVRSVRIYGRLILDFISVSYSILHARSGFNQTKVCYVVVRRRREKPLGSGI